MGVVWISLSTRWGLTSVQAALNVVISVLGTIGIWAFSRYWWQRGGKKVLKSKQDVPLPEILSLSGPGEGYDAIKLLRWKIFTKDHALLLVQLLVIFLVTLACMFAGPLAKVSLRSSTTVRPRNMEVLQAWKSGAELGNSLNDNVKWNDTMTSLDAADFPYDQLLDFLPPSSTPWTYVPHEWDPTWRAACEFEDETILENLEATGNATFYNALEAFPGFKDTYNPSWFNASQFRVQTNQNGETNFTVEEGNRYKDVLVWVVIQSDPSIENRLYTNKGDMKISIAALHAKNFTVIVDDDATQGGLSLWRPVGPVANASFTRVNCNITQKPGELDPILTPWLWTNDTFSLADAYDNMWMTRLSANSTKDAPVIPPSPHELFRFYQAYMVATNTWYWRSYWRNVSTWTDTVQLSVACLTLVLVLTLLELWLTARYIWFLRRNKVQLADTCIPDGKIEWMIYNARLAEQNPNEIHPAEAAPRKDRDYFGRASFGNSLSQEAGVRELARVYTNKGPRPCRNKPPRIVVQTGKDNDPPDQFDGYKLKQFPSSNGSYQGTGLATAPDCGSSNMAPNETPSISGDTLRQQRSRASTVTANRQPCDSVTLPVIETTSTGSIVAAEGVHRLPTTTGQTENLTVACNSVQDDGVRV